MCMWHVHVHGVCTSVTWICAWSTSATRRHARCTLVTRWTKSWMRRLMGSDLVSEILRSHSTRVSTVARFRSMRWRMRHQ